MINFWAIEDTDDGWSVYIYLPAEPLDSADWPSDPIRDAIAAFDEALTNHPAFKKELSDD